MVAHMLVEPLSESLIKAQLESRCSALVGRKWRVEHHHFPANRILFSARSRRAQARESFTFPPSG